MLRLFSCRDVYVLFHLLNAIDFLVYYVCCYDHEHILYFNFPYVLCHINFLENSMELILITLQIFMLLIKSGYSFSIVTPKIFFFSWGNMFLYFIPSTSFYMAMEFLEIRALCSSSLCQTLDSQFLVLKAQILWSSFNHWYGCCSSLTLEGVRRALEKDLGMKAFSLDVHKRFIKQCLEKVSLHIEDCSLIMNISTVCTICVTSFSISEPHCDFPLWMLSLK